MIIDAGWGQIPTWLRYIRMYKRKLWFEKFNFEKAIMQRLVLRAILSATFDLYKTTLQIKREYMHLYLGMLDVFASF